MNAIDFEYDGQYLSDFGFIICDFDGSSGADAVTAGSTLTFNKVMMHNGKRHALTSTKYEECITTTFDICKNPDLYDRDNMEITIDEVRDMMRWLNRREFLKFQVYDEDRDLETCYYDASFNIEKIKIHEVVYGLRLTMETNRPFGYGADRVTKWVIENANTTKILSDISDEIGSIYPKVILKCGTSGTFSITNELYDCTMTIANCSRNEVITIDGESQIITSSDSSHQIYNDFNYEFLKIGNTYANRQNKITVNNPCTLTISYAPIIKDTP